MARSGAMRNSVELAEWRAEFCTAATESVFGSPVQGELDCCVKDSSSKTEGLYPRQGIASTH